jgi:hypothetical protein
VAGLDRVPVQVQLAMDLDEVHRPCVAHQDRERDRAQVLAREVQRGRCHRRDRRRPTALRPAKTVDDVLRIDARPHDEAQLREARADFAELDRERTLLPIELRCLIEQRGALFVQRGETLTPVRQRPVTDRIANGGRHRRFPGAEVSDGGSSPSGER